MLKPLTIAVVAACPFPLGRGTPLRIQRLAEALAAFGHTVHIFTYPIGAEMATSDLLVHRTHNPLGYQKYDAGPSLQKPLLDALLAAQLSRFLAHTRVDILYAHHFEGVLVALSARHGRDIPIVYDAHTTLTGELGTYSTLLQAKPVAFIGHWLDGFVPRQADYVISVSTEIARFLQQRSIPRERISVITNGTEIEAFLQGDALRARAKYDLQQQPTIIYTGNLAAFQGIDYLLAAMPRVLANFPGARLVLAGSGDFTPYRATIAQLGIEQATHLIANPTFTDVTDLLALADVAVVPRPTCPGIPLKLLNYMAAGKAIVTFSGSAKILAHLETGYIVTEDDASALAGGIITCLQDEGLRQKLGARARQTIVRSYSWQHMARRISEVFEGLATREAASVYAPCRELLKREV